MMPARRLTADQLAHAFAMRERGFTYGQIALRLDVSQGAIAWHCLKHGVESPRTTPSLSTGGAKPGAIERRGNHLVRRFTPEEDRMILAMEAAGHNRAAIGRACTPPRAPNSITGRLMTLARHEERAATRAETQETAHA